MEHKFSGIIATCVFALMLSSCEVTTYSTKPTPPPPPRPKPAYHHQPAPGVKRYPIDQVRRSPNTPPPPAKPHPQSHPTPPPPAPSKPSVREVEKNNVRNSGTRVQQSQNQRQEVKSGSSTPQPKVQNNSSRQRNTGGSSSRGGRR